MYLGSVPAMIHVVDCHQKKFYKRGLGYALPKPMLILIAVCALGFVNAALCFRLFKQLTTATTSTHIILGRLELCPAENARLKSEVYKK